MLADVEDRHRVRLAGEPRRGERLSCEPLTYRAVLLGTGPAAPARVQKTAAATGTATFVVTGHGWGHGVGMSQYGAYGYAQKGVGYAKIVLHYFPGTELGAAPVSKVRVLLTSGVSTFPLGSAADFRVRDATGAVHDVSAGSYTLTAALKLKVDGEATARALPGPLLFQPGSSPLQLKHLYRGSIQVDVVRGRRLGGRRAVSRLRARSLRLDLALPQLGSVRVHRREARAHAQTERTGHRLAA